LVKNAPKGRIRFSDFYKIRRGEGVPGPSAPLRQTLPLWLYKYGLTGTKIGNFGINLPQRQIPLSNFFYKICHAGGSRRSAPSCQIPSLWLIKCGLIAPKLVISGVNLPQRSP